MWKASPVSSSLRLSSSAGSTRASPHIRGGQRVPSRRRWSVLRCPLQPLLGAGPIRRAIVHIWTNALSHNGYGLTRITAKGIEDCRAQHQCSIDRTSCQCCRAVPASSSPSGKSRRRRCRDRGAEPQQCAPRCLRRDRHKSPESDTAWALARLRSSARS
jgi:hypothetical protein